MKRFSWKYMAGIVDGEGCIDMQGSIDKRDGTYYCRPRLRLSLSGPPGEMMIPEFIRLFSGCLDGQARQLGNADWMPVHTWILSGKTQLRAFLQNIVNHLYMKKEQARFAIWWLDHITGKHVTQEVRRFGTNEFKAMKRDPHRLSEEAAKQITRILQSSEQ